MNCSTLRERTAGSPPSTSQVSLQAMDEEFDLRPNTGTLQAIRAMAVISSVAASAIENAGPPGPPLPEPPDYPPLRVSTWAAAGVGIQARGYLAGAAYKHLKISCPRWAEAHIKIGRMTLTIKLHRNWSSFRLANRAPPLSVTDSSIAPSARMRTSLLTRISNSTRRQSKPMTGCVNDV